MRLRKNINCLNSNELHDLREAFAGIYNLPDAHPNSFATIAGLHGSPPPSYCIHGNNGFLSWHRAYLLEIENALRTIHCDVALPYWNWSSGSTTGVPAACRDSTYVDRGGHTVPNPLYSGPKPASIGGGQTSRSASIDTRDFGPYATMAQNAIAQPVWSDFVSDLNSVHGAIHGAVGGDMGSVPGAGFDPIFHLHHANVDRLWANWQIANPMPLPASEANAVLEPFTRPYTNAWHRGIDFNSTLDWDFKYQNWCFILPPFDWVFERIFRIPIDPWVFDSRRIAVSLSSAMMPMQSFEVRVFINNEKATVRTKLDEASGFAGSLGFFGMGDAQMFMRKGEEFKSTLDITSRLRACIKKKDKKCPITLVPVSFDGTKLNLKALKRLKLDLEVD